jgi:hypothetical protein
MPYIFYSLFDKNNLTTQYIESIEDEKKHLKAVAIVSDLEDMINAAKQCKGKGKKIYLIEAVDDLVCAMSASETVWPNEIMEKYEAFVADTRLSIAAINIDDVAVVDEDDAMMLEFATASEDVDMRLRLVSRWSRK